MVRTFVRDKKNNVLSNSCTVGGRSCGLVTADAEKPGPAVQELKAHYECPSTPGSIGHRRRDGHGDHARNRNALSTLAPRGRAGRPAVGEITEQALLEERGGNRRTIEWSLAGGPLVMRFQLLHRQLEAGLENVRLDPVADCRV